MIQDLTVYPPAPTPNSSVSFCMQVMNVGELASTPCPAWLDAGSGAVESWVPQVAPGAVVSVWFPPLMTGSMPADYWVTARIDVSLMPGASLAPECRRLVTVQ